MSRLAASRAAGLALLAAAAGASAQAGGVLARSPTDGVALPPAGAALADQATALAINPAGLRLVPSLELVLVHDRDIARNGVGDAVFVGDSAFGVVSAGLAIQWIRFGAEPSFRSTSWALALGSPRLSLGLALHLYGSTPSAELSRLTTFDAGLRWQPFDALALGAALTGLEGSSLDGTRLPRRLVIGLGVKPPGRSRIGDRVRLGIDATVDDARGLRGGWLALAASIEPLSGLTLRASVARSGTDGRVAGQIGLTLDGPHVGFGYAAGFARGARGGDHVGHLRISAGEYRPVSVGRARWAVLDIGALLAPEKGVLATLLGDRVREPYLALLGVVDGLRDDPAIAGVVVKVGEVDLGAARVEELRAALGELKGAGKRVLALVAQAGDAELLLASVADRVFALPQATFLVNGYQASATFFAEGLGRLGVDVDVARVGPHKASPDQWTRSDMSPEQREMLAALVDGATRRFTASVALARGIPEAKLREVVGRGVLTAKAARDAGLVDAIAYPDEVERIVEEIQGDAVELVDAANPPPVYPRRWDGLPRIAVVPVEGLIADGKSRSDPFGVARVAGAQTVVRALLDAAEDPGVAAVVLRVESPGGSVAASDLVWRTAVQVRAVKPVVASLGDTAASGGYWVAMAGDEIVAEPSTVTGSIGVFALKPSVAGLLGKLGVHREVVKREERADMMSMTRRWTDGELEAMQRFVDETYDGFVERVAQARRMDKARVDAVARGRVFDGERARELGLVDALGGLGHAVERAKSRAGLAGRAVRVTVLGTGRDLLPLEGLGASGAEVISRLGARLLPQGLAALEMPDGPLAMLPWALEVR